MRSLPQSTDAMFTFKCMKKSGVCKRDAKLNSYPRYKLALIRAFFCKLNLICQAVLLHVIVSVSIA